MAGSTSTHNLRVITTLEGFDQVTTQLNGFGKTTTGLVTQQDALQSAMGKTQGAAIKTGQEFTKVSKEQTNTSKTSKSLGESFKSSSLMITAFASSLISSIGQLISFEGASVKLDKAHAALEKREIALQQAENKLAAGIASGKIEGTAADLQSQKLAATRRALEADTEKLRLKEEEHNLSLVNLATSIVPTVITGISSLNNIYGSIKGTLDSATQATNETSTATEQLGTVADTTQTIGIIPMLKSFANWVTGAKDVGTENTNLTGGLQNMGTELKNTEQTGNIVVRAFKAMGSSIVSFANNIKTDIGSATGTIDKIKTGFSSFFSILGSGLKAGIQAVIEFGKAMITAIVTNPVLLVITAISAAVLALITNFGGFRDMINGVGVAIGNAIPGLKGLLDWFGQGANAALDAAAGLAGFDTQAKKTGQTARQTATAMDPLLVAMNRYLQLGNQFDKVAEIEKHFVRARIEITNLGTQVDASGKLMADSMFLFANAFETAMADIPNKSQAVKDAIQKVHEVVNLLDKGGISAATAQKMLSDALTNVGNAAGTEVTQIEKVVVAQQIANEAAAAGGKVMTEAEKILSNYSDTQKLAESQFKDFALAYVQGNYDIIEAMGLSEEEIVKLRETFDKEFSEGAVVVEQFGEKIVKSIITIKEQFGGTSKDITTYVDDIGKALAPSLVDKFFAAEEAVRNYNKEQEYLQEVSDLAATSITKDSDRWVVAIKRILEAYPELGKTADQVAQDIVKAQEEQAKARDKENQTVDKQIEKAKDLAQTRQDEILADQALTQEATNLIASMNQQIMVTDMTGKGLQSLIKIYDDTANAVNVAADTVGLWYAELKKGDAVNTATKDKLLELASNLGIAIPQAILDKGIPAIKDFIQETTGLGDAAEKAAQRAIDAFDSIAQKGQEGLADLINEDLIKGDLDEVIQKIEETGRSLDQLSVQSVVIKPLLETVDFEDDLNSLTEIMGEEWAEMDLKAKEGGDQVMQTYFDGLTETFGSEAQPLINTMDTIWTNIKRENPGKTGNELLQIFMDAMNKPSEMERLTNSLAQSGANGFASGSHYFATAGEKAKYELMKMWDPAGAEAYAKGVEVGGNIPKGAAAGIKNLSGTAAEEMRNMGMLMIGQLNMILDSEVNSTLPGYVTLFGQKFTEIGDSAANLATAAQTHFTNVTTYLETMWTKFSDWSVSMDTYLTGVDTKIATFTTNTDTNFGIIDTAILLTETNISSFWEVWDKVLGEADQKQKDFATSSTTEFGNTDKALQLTETNVSSLYKVWESAMDEMTQKVETFADACVTQFDKVVKAAETAQEAVEALQKAIDALKDKTVTITTRYVTEGSPARFGGASIGFARTGDSWIQNKPARIGGMNVAEFSKPELITVTPLSNPYDVSDKSIGGISSTAGGGRGGSPVIVSGDLYVTVKTQSGETLANEVKPYILKHFSGIT